MWTISSHPTTNWRYSSGICMCLLMTLCRLVLISLWKSSFLMAEGKFICSYGIRQVYLFCAFFILWLTCLGQERFATVNTVCLFQDGISANDVAFLPACSRRAGCVRARCSTFLWSYHSMEENGRWTLWFPLFHPGAACMYQVRFVWRRPWAKWWSTYQALRTEWLHGMVCWMIIRVKSCMCVCSINLFVLVCIVR